MSAAVVTTIKTFENKNTKKLCSKKRTKDGEPKASALHRGAPVLRRDKQVKNVLTKVFFFFIPVRKHVLVM